MRCECVSECCPVMDWQPVQGVTSRPMCAGDRHGQTPVTPKGNKVAKIIQISLDKEKLKDIFRGVKTDHRLPVPGLHKADELLKPAQVEVAIVFPFQDTDKSLKTRNGLGVGSTNQSLKNRFQQSTDGFPILCNKSQDGFLGLAFRKGQDALHQTQKSIPVWAAPKREKQILKFERHTHQHQRIEKEMEARKDRLSLFDPFPPHPVIEIQMDAQNPKASCFSDIVCHVPADCVLEQESRGTEHLLRDDQETLDVKELEQDHPEIFTSEDLKEVEENASPAEMVSCQWWNSSSPAQVQTCGTTDRMEDEKNSMILCRNTQDTAKENEEQTRDTCRGEIKENKRPDLHKTVLSFVSCFAGGVFLSACLLDIIPDYLSDIHEELVKRDLDDGFPLAEFIMACGFFTVLILEKLVLSCREGHGSDETAPLLAPAGNGHAHGHPILTDVEGSGHHIHVDLHAHSSFRSFMLFLSLSLHSVFEGLAIGLQTTDAK
ncbi:hypothetical protein DNTS_028166, partial [Danionella cerebrum]